MPGHLATTMTEPTTLGRQMHALVERLYPLCRSITGDGVRATLVFWRSPSRSPCTRYPPAPGSGLDRAQGVEHPGRLRRRSEGRRVIDFTKSNLHVVGYSVPVRTRMSLSGSESTCTRCPTSRPRSIPHELLQGGVGILPVAEHPRFPARR